MSFNLIESAKSLFTNELAGQAGAYLNEGESGISKAISGILPAVFSGMANKSATPEGANIIAEMAREYNQSGVLDNMGSVLSGSDHSGLLSKASGLIGGLFGNKSADLNNIISVFSGIRSSSVTSLLSMATPIVLSLIGKHASANNLNAGEIASLLSSQKQNIANATPAGLNLSSIFSHSVPAAAAVKTVHKTVHEEKKSEGSGIQWLIPVLLLALLGAAALYLYKDGGDNKHEGDMAAHAEKSVTTSVEETVTVDKAGTAGSVDSLGNFIYNVGNMVTIELPNAAGKLVVGENSTEAKLVRFLQDSNAMIDSTKGNWFDFTNVRFNTASAEITAESMEQLRNMVAITKAFPAAQFKVGGYTDNTGDEAKNITLSKNRAIAVAAKLKSLGASEKSIINADGYGSQFPIGDNSTKEGKAQNRRVSVNVKAK